MPFKKNRQLIDLKGNLNTGSINVTSTVIKLCKIPIQLHTGDTIWFSTPEKQLEFFDKYTVHEFENCTYVRIEEGFTQLPINVENLRKDVNYICIKNKGFSDKWYYCNILSINWVNTVTSKINFAIDTIQTFRFDMEFNQPSHIIKRHFSYDNDGERVINGLPDISFDIGSKLYTVENGITYYEITDGGKTKLELNVIYSDDDACYIINTSQPFKGSDGSEIKSADMKSCDIDMQNSYYSDKPYSNTPVKKDTIYDYSMMGDVYIMDNKCMNECIKNNVFTNDKNNGIIQHISYLPLTWKYCVRSDAENLADKLVGAGKGRMTSLNNMRTGNKQKIIYGFNMIEYYNRGLDVDLSDEEYIKYLVNSTYGVSEDVIALRKNAVIQYLLRPYFTKFTINDHANNIIDYDIRYFNNGTLEDDNGYEHIYKDRYFDTDVKIKGFEVEIITMLATSPQPVINWILNNYNFGKDGRYNLQSVYEGENSAGLLTGDVGLLNNDGWLKIIPNLYFPVVNDYYSMFLMANKYQLSAQRNNINRNYQTALANASTTLDAGLNNAYLNYQGNLASAKALQANASIQYGASVQIANNNYNNAINISQNNLATAMDNASRNKATALENNQAKYGDWMILEKGLTSLNANPFDLFGLTSAVDNMLGSNANEIVGRNNANNAYNIAQNNAFLANDNAQLNATNSYNNAMIQASATANMLRNTANAQMTMAYNAYKGQQGILNANYQNEIRNAKTVQQNAIDMLNASIRDAQNVADSMTCQYQGDNTQFFSTTISPIWTLGCVKPEYLKRIVNTFKYYGFTCNEFNKIDDVINKWTVGGYIQTSNCMVNGAIPYQWLLDIIEQFNTGIRLWKDEENFLNFSDLLKQ